MAQETYAAILRLVNPEVNGEFSVSFSLPNSNKPTVYTWNKANKFEAEIPTKISYVDDHKKKQVFAENYAKDILNAYGFGKKVKMPVLEFVRECKRDEYVPMDFPVAKPIEQKIEVAPVEASVPEVQEEQKEEIKSKGNKK